MSLTSIDLGLRDLLSDPRRRQEFFKSITQDEIASQIRALRKKRALTQSAFAKLAEMRQSAVSRIEQADYSAWSLSTLFRVADALNARWRITLEPCEDAIAEIERLEDASAEEFGDAARCYFEEEKNVGQGRERERSALGHHLETSYKNAAGDSTGGRFLP